jgi:hypothetical protein
MNKDLLHKVLEVIDHNRYTVISAALFVALMLGITGVVGCDATTTGITNGAPVTRQVFDRQVIESEKNLTVQRIGLENAVAAFNAEIEAFNARVEAGYDDLERKEVFRAEVINTVGGVITTAAEGTLNPAALIPIGIGLLGGALGLGTAADNRRKDAVIKKIKVDEA